MVAETESAATPDMTATPVMAQYLALKSRYADALLFFRLGDFYELFFEDAEKAARALNLTLTRRGRHLGAEVPMCGVPAHASDVYLARLIRAGFKVAVCEQMEDPAAAKRRGGKGLIGRDVVRLVTPGTLTEESLLEARAHNYLAALASVPGQGGLGLAWVDISTGEFHLALADEADLPAALARIDPGEIVVADHLLNASGVAPAVAPFKHRLTPLPAAKFDRQAGERRLKLLYGVTSLDGFGAFSAAEVAAAGALVDYVELTQKGRLPGLGAPRRVAANAFMAIDAATRRNLELAQSFQGGRAGSLLDAIDRTLTAAGARLLAERLAAPLTDPAAIEDRLDMVTVLLDKPDLRAAIRREFRAMPDMVRALSRLSLARGGPRDLAALRDGLTRCAALRRALAASGAAPALAAVAQGLGDHGGLVDELSRALAPDLPLLARDGGFIAAGYRAGVDELRGLRDESRRHIAALQAGYATATGVAALKIRHNNVIGYFVEINPRFAGQLGPEFRHRQSLANAARYGTDELAGLESRIGQAAARVLALELELYEALVAAVATRADAIRAAAAAAAALDVAASLAELAAEQGWCRPLVDLSLGFDIRRGRHPVVAAALRAEGGPPFVANDCDLAPEHRLWLLTGPNMAGKSTYLRQNALMAVLAQAGCYVPAESAHIGVVDRLFSRVGAGDDLARGRSTFMVEMLETAAILNQAGPRALVILDEIGRGTATFDGLSIAWATVEHLHDVNRCRAIFATHFHELTALAAKLAALSNHTMRVKEWRGEVVFLHEVAPGAADRAYGLHVAKLAGVPRPVLKRAGEVLNALEKSGQSGAVGKLVDDLPLFSALPESPNPPAPSAVETALAGIDLDGLTPRAALDALYRLRSLLSGGGTGSSR